MAEIKKKQKKKKSKAPGETLTLKYWLLGGGIVVLLVALVVGAALLLAAGETVKFTEEDGMLVREDGVMYMKATPEYAARYVVTGRGQKPYGKTDSKDGIYKMGYYNAYGVLMELDPDRYLADREGNVYYSSNSTLLPDLASFDTDCVYVCTDEADEITMSLLSLKNDSLPVADDFVEEILDGKRYSAENGGIPLDTYRLYFTSPTYGYLYYVMYLVRCDNGDYYVYSDSDRSSVAISARFAEKYLEKALGDAGTADTTGPEDTTDTPVTDETPDGN